MEAPIIRFEAVNFVPERLGKDARFREKEVCTQETFGEVGEEGQGPISGDGTGWMIPKPPAPPEPEAAAEEEEGPVEPAALELRADNERIAALEGEVIALRDELAALQRAFEEFKGQF